MTTNYELDCGLPDESVVNPQAGVLSPRVRREVVVNVRALVVAAAVVASGAAHAQTRTFVKLAGKDDSIRKLGVPAISVQVFGARLDEATTLRDALGKDLAAMVHTRTLAAGDSGDYALEVTLLSPQEDGSAMTLPFEAVLRQPDGTKLWAIDGHTETVGAPVGAEALTSLSRNLVSAMIHDGWVQPKYDPDNPPPPAPTIHRDPSDER